MALVYVTCLTINANCRESFKNFKTKTDARNNTLLAHGKKPVAESDLEGLTSLALRQMDWLRLLEFEDSCNCGPCSYHTWVSAESCKCGSLPDPAHVDPAAITRARWSELEQMHKVIEPGLLFASRPWLLH